jgi:ferredoxin
MRSSCEEKNKRMNAQDWIPRIDRSACTGCGDCIALCPTGALGMVKGKAAVVRPDACTYCNACEDACPVDAIELPYLICFSSGNPDEEK